MKAVAARAGGPAVALGVAALLLVVTVVVTGELTAGYDPRYDTVSRLGSPGQPYAIWIRAAIAPVGTLTAWIALRWRRRGPSSPVGWLVCLAGVATVVVAIAPKAPEGATPTLVSHVHVAAAAAGVGALVAAMALILFRSRHRAERHGSAVAMALIAVFGAAFPFTWGTVVYGILQRIILATALTWLVAVPARHSRRIPHSRQNSDGHHQPFRHQPSRLMQTSNF